MGIISILWKFKDFIMAGIIILMIFGYFVHDSNVKKAYKNQIESQQKIISNQQAQLETQTVLIKQQNDAVDQMKKYSDQKDREISEATHLAEKMQDTVDLQSQQLLNSKTNIDQSFSDLTGCKAELDRIRAFMFNAEQSLTSSTNGTK